MGANQTVPSYQTIGSVLQNVCYTGEQPGLSFLHTHSVDMSTNFTQILNIGPRIYPLALIDQSHEEIFPGSYSAILKTEIEGIEIESVLNSESIDVTSTIPFTDDITFALNASCLPTYDISFNTKVITNMINASIQAKTVDNFKNLYLSTETNVALSNSLLVGGAYTIDLEKFRQGFELMASFQTLRNLFCYTYNHTNSISTFGWNFTINNGASIGSKIQVDHDANIKVGTLGYNMVIGNNSVCASISSELSTCAKFVRDTGKGLTVSVGLTSNMLKQINAISLGLQLDTGKQI